MSIIDTIKNLLGSAQSHLPENLNSADELRARAQELAGQHGETVNKVVDGIQEKIPGQAGDTAIDGAQDKLNSFNTNDKK